MSERSDNAKSQCSYQTNTKMSESDLGTKKTLIVLVVVVGCFAILWPKVLYPMLLGPANQRMKPNNLDKGCCDVISDIDINTIKIMNELCNTIVQETKEKSVKRVVDQCRKEVFNKCGIDISVILQEQIRLGRSFKQIVDEVRSHNGSLCLKYQFGISPWRLGAPHIVTVNLSPIYVRQERPSHLRPEMLHPALREKGSAIVQPYQQPPKPGPHRYVEGRPGPVPGVRPPMGGAGHMVHSPKSSNSMGVIMPIYTVGIVIFFSYTLMKLLFKKKPEGPGAPLYSPVEPSATFRKEVFESQKRKSPQGPLIGWKERDARDEELDTLRNRLRETELAMERIVEQMGQVPLRSQKEDVLANGSAKAVSQEHDQPSVKILGMEMTASCEGGQKWERSESPVIPKPNQPNNEPIIPPQEIFLEGTLPAQSQLLVADSTIEEEANSISSSTDPPVILASKMTLSVISLDAQENGNDNLEVEESKYTTASEATVADCEISDEEEDNEIEEDVAKMPEGFENINDVQESVPEIIHEPNVDIVEDKLVDVENGEEEIETIEKSERIPERDKEHGEEIEEIVRSEDNLDDEEEIEEIIRSDDDFFNEPCQCDLENDEEIENIDRSDDDSLNDVDVEEIIVFEEDIEDDDFEHDFGQLGNRLSPDTQENIGKIIDEIITDGALRLENANENDFILGNVRHFTTDFIDNCDNTNEDEDNYDNNNESLLDQDENTFEQHIEENDNLKPRVTTETNQNVESTDIVDVNDPIN